MPRERLGGGTREAGKGRFDRGRPRVRRCQPEHGVGVGEGLVDNRRVAVRADHNVEVLAGAGREV
jgi:hypothetical protein